MTGSERRQAILKALKETEKPLSGTALGELLGVSRQVIVQDIALLRTSGYEIVSTHRGYLVGSSNVGARRLVKVQHGPDQIEQELNLIVDHGGIVEDILVNHRTYAKIEAPLNVKSRRDVKKFVEDIQNGVSSPLSTITSGYHFHHISAESDEVLDEIVAALDELGFLAPFTDYEKYGE